MHTHGLTPNSGLYVGPEELCYVPYPNVRIAPESTIFFPTPFFIFFESALKLGRASTS